MVACLVDGSILSTTARRENLSNVPFVSDTNAVVVAIVATIINRTNRSSIGSIFTRFFAAATTYDRSNRPSIATGFKTRTIADATTVDHANMSFIGSIFTRFFAVATTYDLSNTGSAIFTGTTTGAIADAGIIHQLDLRTKASVEAFARSICAN
eukprot:CAMPEP_0201658920 /NCGR_PEP_ID=MMETSP0494-20130426/1798_1 /ASSEMBLY_ACC=CAM_ASM_000839 /TAXON_ID=420259 /ORGANISM="Thalassiosira gravida, Strain GMp14c1" /LENGTH=153 /DNA_ID=CAMNT_0048136203 /DNA_START=211 /DNA_END=672 /DNA_ORIENTATION=+